MRNKHYWPIFVGLIVVYVALVYTLPSDPRVLERYHLTDDSLRLLNLTVVAPLVAIWLAAFYGFVKLKEYASSVTDTPEGKPFHTLADGLMILVFTLPLLSSLSTLLTYVGRHNSALLPETTMLRNYLGLAFALGAFYLIGKGAEALAKHVKPKTKTFDEQRWTVGFIVFSSLFSWLIVAHYPAPTAEDNPYYLPTWLVVLTIAIPYLYVWYRGLLAAYCIYFYRTRVKGSLYKQALNFLSIGLAIVIGISIALQFLTVFGSQLNQLKLAPVLLIVYLLVVFYAVGYGLIAKAAKRLKTFEEV